MQINSFPYAKLKENIFRETNEKKKKKKIQREQLWYSLNPNFPLSYTYHTHRYKHSLYTQFLIVGINKIININLVRD